MKIILLLFFFVNSFVWAQDIASPKKSILELSTMADLQCIDFKVLGFCPKPNREPPIGIKVKYWQPEVFMETVKMPGDYVITEYGALLNSISKNIAKNELQLATGLNNLTVTSGSSSSSLSGSNLQFNEVHLYDFPLASVLDVTLCSEAPNGTLGVRYLSEMDSISWRKGDIENNPIQSLAGPQMKTWGPLYPREGFVITPSAPVASAIDAMRAVSIAGNPLPLHIVESKLNFQPNIPIDKVQMLYPAKSACFPIGQDPKKWEQNKQSREGQYVWIYWHQRQCCI